MAYTLTISQSDSTANVVWDLEGNANDAMNERVARLRTHHIEFARTFDSIYYQRPVTGTSVTLTYKDEAES